MKLSKSDILPNIIITAIICLYIFLLKPLTEEPYLEKYIGDFKDRSWKYTIGLCLLLYLLAIVLFLKMNEITDRLYLFVAPLAFLFFSSFIIKGIIDHVLLYSNTLTGNQQITESYTVLKGDQNEIIYLIDSKKNAISNEDDIAKIDAIRKAKNQKSLFLLEDDDTLHVTYKTGFFNVKFIE
jgi:hypothetical protein